MSSVEVTITSTRIYNIKLGHVCILIFPLLNLVKFCKKWNSFSTNFGTVDIFLKKHYQNHKKFIFETNHDDLNRFLTEKRFLESICLRILRLIIINANDFFDFFGKIKIVVENCDPNFSIFRVLKHIINSYN